MANVEVSVSLAARLELGHALGEWCARRSDARVLHIKGVAAQAVMPVVDSRSTDVDLLVHPDDFARYLRLLVSAGGTEIVDDGSRSSEAHAVSVVSPGLSVSLDVHRSFPGFRAPAREVFDRLWAHSLLVDLGGWECRVLDRVGLTTVGVVHAARNDGASTTHRTALSRWQALQAEEQKELDGLVESLGATAAAQVALGRHAHAPPWETALFRAHRDGARPVALWLLTLAAAPSGRVRLSVLRRALLGRAGIVGDAVPPRPGTSARGSGGGLRRLIRSAVELGPALRDVMRYRRG